MYNPASESYTNKENKKPSPSTSSHLHTGVKGRLALKVIHDNPMVTIDHMLIDALSTEMFKHFVDTVNAIENSLKEKG